MKRYNIIWVDDEFDKQITFVGLAENLGFDIIERFKTARDAMDYLERNFFNVDGVILDAKAFNETEHEVPSVTGMHESLRRIEVLAERHHVPEFPVIVLTGQPDLEDDQSFRDSLGRRPMFWKTGDPKHLFDKLRRMIELLPHSEIRNQFRPLYDACTDGVFDAKMWERISKILLSLRSGNHPASGFNEIRTSLEWLLRLLIEKGILPSEFVEGDMVQIRPAVFFLTGKETRLSINGVPHQIQREGKQPVVPAILKDFLHAIINVSNPGSHSDTGTPNYNTHSLKDIEDIVGRTNHHVLQIVTLMFVDLLVWFQSYIERHPDPDSNRRSQGQWQPYSEESRSIRHRG